MSESRPQPGARLRAAVSATLAGYWLVLFIGTHWPKLNLGSLPQNSDKALHFLAYGGLGFLIAVWVSTRREVRAADVGRIFAVVCGYSILDELTQIPVGRSCELLDAVADWAGCLVGLSAFFVLRSAIRRIAAAQRMAA